MRLQPHLLSGQSVEEATSWLKLRIAKTVIQQKKREQAATKTGFIKRVSVGLLAMGIGSFQTTQKDFAAIAGNLGRKKKGGKQEPC